MFRKLAKQIAYQMGPLHKLASLFNSSAVDVNENMKNKAMSVGVDKTFRFASDLDIFRDSERIKGKAYIWTSVRLPKKRRGKRTYLKLKCLLNKQ